LLRILDLFIERSVICLVSHYDFVYFNNILLLSMFLVCSSCMLDIVMIYDDYIHMFVKRLIRYSSRLGGAYYVSVVLRYYMYL
jgi:hypothetical protein